MSWSKRVVWNKDMYNALPHCMSNTKGGPRRLWGKWEDDDLCIEDHSDNPKVVADVEWLRFIRTFIHIWEEKGNHEENNPFTDTYGNDDKRLILHSYHDFAVNNHVYPYAEEYWLRKPTSAGEFSLIFAVYLDNDNERANVSCFDSDYVNMCGEVYARVKEQYLLDATARVL